MKETPIIMSGNHPKLILDGLKTQTRRVIKPQPELLIEGQLSINPKTINKFVQHFLPRCPYGQVGDRLWIEQTWRVSNVTSPMSKGIVTIEFKAGNPNVQLTNNEFAYNQQGIYLPVTYTAIRTRKWQSAMFMPKSIASIWNVITEVRVERLQEITANDAVAEGCYPYFEGKYFHPPRGIFRELWDSLNAKRGYGWDTNPWVWVPSFRIIV